MASRRSALPRWTLAWDGGHQRRPTPIEDETLAGGEHRANMPFRTAAADQWQTKYVQRSVYNGTPAAPGRILGTTTRYSAV